MRQFNHRVFANRDECAALAPCRLGFMNEFGVEDVAVEFLRRADVGGFLDDLGYGEGALDVRVADGRGADAQAPGRGRDHSVGFNPSRFESQGDCKGFQRRARLECVGEGAVPELRADESVAVVRVVGREIGEREQLPGVDVENHDAARLRPVLLDRGSQGAECEVLDAHIQREREVAPVLRRLDRFDVLDGLAEPILDHAPAARLAGEPVLKFELDALLADVVRAGKAEHVRRDFTARVIAPILAVLEHSGNAQGRNPLRRFRRDLPLEENEVPTYVGEAFLDLPRRHLEYHRQPLELRSARMRLAWNRPDRLHRRADRESVAVAVEDAAPVRRDLDDPAVARLAFCLQEVVVHGLQVGGAAEQQRGSGDGNGKQKARTPGGERQREDRAGGELHCAAPSGRTM